MPTMANITVKKADGTTDVVYNAMAPSSGDGVPAVWRAEAVASTAAFKPRLECRTRWNAAKTARRVDAYFVLPITQTDTASGITTVIGQVPLNLSVVMPVNANDSIVAEAAAQSTNLMVSTLFRSILTSGFAPS